MKSTLLTGLFVFMLGLLLAGPITFAQGVGSSGGIRGTLTDPAGGVIPKATIVAEDAEKGIRRTSPTDENGQYEFAGLPPATYRLTAKISGFQTEILKDVVVTVGQTVILDFRMKISAGTEVIEGNDGAAGGGNRADPPGRHHQRAVHQRTAHQPPRLSRLHLAGPWSHRLHAAGQ